MANFKDVGRNAMIDRHSVFKVHDIPPAAYFGPGIPSGVIPEFRTGDVCSRGLWDEAVDAPVAYPFIADRSGFCYIPNYTDPNANRQILREAIPPEFRPPLAALDPEKPRLQTGGPTSCVMACKWSD